MVHIDMPNIPRIVRHLKRANRLSPYCSVSQCLRVYITNATNDTASASVDPMAAPAIPIAGIPQCPNTNIQLNTAFDTNITTEFTVNALVCVVPM